MRVTLHCLCCGSNLPGHPHPHTCPIPSHPAPQTAQPPRRSAHCRPHPCAPPTQVDVCRPVKALARCKIARVAAGAQHSLMLTSGGEVFACGDGSSGGWVGGWVGTRAGRAGIPRALPRQGGKQRRRRRPPQSPGLPRGAHHPHLAPCPTGALGHGGTDGCASPRAILRVWPLGVVAVACGGSHSAALALGGSVLTWGRGKHGQLGHGDFSNRSGPTLRHI